MLNIKILRILLIISFFISFSALSYLIVQTFFFKKKIFYSRAKGNSLKGIIYSLGKGMLPWEKESVRKNIIVYLAGVLYHSGIFASFLFLFINLFNLKINSILFILKIVIFSGLLSGIGLLLRRTFSSFLRKISIPDDFLANLFVDGFLFFSFISTFDPSNLPYLYLYSIILLLYIPSGKIRHCFFFFYSKIISGIFFGRRGVFEKRELPGSVT